MFDSPAAELLAKVPSPVLVEEGLASQPWVLVFGDDFDQSLDTDMWTSCYWWSESGCTNLATGELQWYVPDQRSVQDGSLRLYGANEPIRTSEGVWYPYQSGMVTTGRSSYLMDAEPRFGFTYGFVEARVRVDAGRGLWPAVWMLPLSHEARPEIDILEILGHRPDTIEMHMHVDNDDGNSTVFGANYSNESTTDGWHVVAVNWSPESVTWYIDGVERFRVAQRIPAEPMYLLANLAIGGEWPGDPDGLTVFPATFEIDYVRVWQQDMDWFTTTGTFASR